MQRMCDSGAGLIYATSYGYAESTQRVAEKNPNVIFMQALGTKQAANVGTYSNIEIRVSDGKANASLAPFGITVRLGNRAPVITGNPATFTMQGQAYSFAPGGSDADGDSLVDEHRQCTVDLYPSGQGVDHDIRIDLI